MKLTPKQEAFVAEYLIDLNASAAYKRAGYVAKGNSAEVNAVRLLRNAQVKVAIQTAMDARSKEVGLTAANVLRDIDLVKADAMRKTYDKEGNEVMANHAAALKALELQGKHLKMFTEKMEVTGKDGAPLRPMSGLSTEEIRAALALIGAHG